MDGPLILIAFLLAIAAAFGALAIRSRLAIAQRNGATPKTRLFDN